MGDDDQTGSGTAVELEHQVEHLRGGVAVEITGRLVSEHDGGRGDQRARQCDALALAARQFAGSVLDAIGEPHALQDTCRRGARPLGRLAADEQRHRHVVERGKFRQQMMELVDKPECAIAQPPLVGVA